MTNFERFQPMLFEFLEQLADNNNRPWFQETKGDTSGTCWSPRWPSSAPSSPG